MKLSRTWWLLLGAFCALLIAPTVYARRAIAPRIDDLTLTLTNTPVTGAQGSGAIVRATVTNNSNHDIYLNALSGTMNDTDQIYGDDTPFFANFVGKLAPGATITNKGLFVALIDINTPPFLYNGTVAILGGANPDAQDSLAQQDFQVIVVGKDATPPDTTITSGPDDGGIACGNMVTFGFTGTDDITPLSDLFYQYRVDGGDWTTTDQTTANLTLNSEGTHTFEVAAIDASGNIDPTPAKRTFTLLLTPPTASNINATPKDVKTTITWATNRPATSQVEYGLTAAYGQSSGLSSDRIVLHSVALTGLTPKTLYHYRIKSNDGCRDVVSDDQTFTTLDMQYPNLAVTSLSFASPVRALDTIAVSWQALNSGPGDAEGTWVDSVYLSSSATLDATATLLGKFDRAAPLDAFSSYDQTRQIQMPLVQAGSYYILVKTDGDNAVQETSEDDNVLAMPIEFLKVSNLVASPDQISLSLNPTVAIQGQVSLGNLSGGALTGIKATIENAQPNLNIQVNPPTSLNSLATQQATYTVTAGDESILQSAPVIHFTSAEGEDARVTLNVTVIPRRPQLVANPGSFMGGMTRGKQNTLEVQVTNTGSVYATGLSVSVPKADWLSLSSPVTIGTLAPGATTTISLLLSPSASTALGPYTGSIVLNGTNTSLILPFNIACTSDAKGDLKVIAQDEYSFFAADKPNVTGASIVIKDPQTGVVVAQGTTDDQGTLELLKLPEGSYNLEATADKHGTAKLSLTILPGQEITIKPFLPRQLVTYNWSVVPVDTADKYVVTLQTTFETHVPAPVVTISPAYLDARKLQFNADGNAVVNYVITNHGLIAANGAKFTFGSNTSYTVTPALQDLGTLDALTTRVVPVTIKKNTMPRIGSVDCSIPGSVTSFYICDTPVTVTAPATIITGDGCTGFVPQGEGGGSGYLAIGPGTVINGISLCDPCLQKRFLIIVGCLLDFCYPNCTAFYNQTRECVESCENIKLVSCYKNCRHLPWKMMRCEVELLRTEMLCPGAVGHVSSNIKKVLKCVYDVLTACDDIKIQSDPSLVELQKHYNRVQAYADSLEAFYGSSAWLNVESADNNTWGKWMDTFLQSIDFGSDGDELISDAERATLLSMPLPQPITNADAVKLIERWNRTVNYNNQGITSTTDVPAGMSVDFIAIDAWQPKLTAAATAEVEDNAEGYTSLYDGLAYAINLIRNQAENPEQGTCARVKVNISQDVALTRSAFQATLQLANNPANVQLQNVSVVLDIRDQNNVSANQLFGIPAPTLSGITSIDGSGVIKSGETGTVGWTITPTRDAAPMVSTTYRVGGTVSYTEGNNTVVVPLFPAQITVKPDPLLQFHYFWQRDVYSDDPFTPDIEPSEPFALGLLVVNKGYGTARNLTVASSQPQIVDNDKGLLIAFKIIGSQINSLPVSPSLLINFGDVAPQDTATATFFLTSTLQGQFIDYSASFKHVDDLGNPRTSLIDSVDIHELEHVVRVDTPTDDGKPDFLVNDIPDANKLPDTVWMSDGTTAPVTARTDAVTDGLVSDSHLKVHLSLQSGPQGFVYIRTDDPALGKYQLLRVIRSDGKEIRINDNAWTTDRTIRLQGSAPMRQQRLYLFDKDTTGAYTLIYGQLAPAKVSSGGAKKLGNGGQVTLTDVVVTALFPDCFYVENQDRSGGLKVTYGTPQGDLKEQALVTLTGTMRTDANGERYVEANTVSVTGAQAMDALGLTTRSYYGGDYAYDADSGAGQIGMTGGAGLTTVGLFTRTVGQVSSVQSSDRSVQISDGYGGTVKVKTSGSGASPSMGDYIGVTGIASMELNGGKYLPVIRTRRPQDINTDLSSLGQAFVSPANTFANGVNLFALPAIPLNPTPPAVLNALTPPDGSGLFGRFFRFDAPTQNTVFYNQDTVNVFGNLLMGDGYQLSLDKRDAKTIAYNGYRGDFADRWLSVPRIGLTQLGSPLPFSINWESMLVTDGDRTVTLRDGAAEVPLWVNPLAQYFDPLAQMYKNLNLPENNPDSVLFMPWYAYLVTSSRDKLALIAPLTSAKPEVDALDPASIVAGSPGVMVRVTGKGFISGSLVCWGGVPLPTTYLSSTSLQATVPTSDLAAASVVPVTVTNGSFGSVSNGLPFTVNNPVPFLVSLSSTSAQAGSPGFALVITGTGFTESSVVRWNNGARPTTYLSPGQVSAYISDADLANGGTASVQVFNSSPGGGMSNGLLFTINALAQDVSDKVKVTRGGFRYNRSTKRYVQTVTLTNITNNPIVLPLSLVLDNLGAGMTLFNKTGVTNQLAPANSPYLDAPLIGANLAAGASVDINLEFTDPSGAVITYGTRVLAGIGAR